MPLAREGVFTYLDPAGPSDWPGRVEVSRAYECEPDPWDPWEIYEADIETIMASGFSREHAEMVLYRASRAYEVEEDTWDEARAKMLAEIRAVVAATSAPRREPRGKRRRSRQVRSTRARARRRVEAREQRRAS